MIIIKWLINTQLHIFTIYWSLRQIHTSRDFEAAEEIVILRRTARVADHVDDFALKLVDDVDGGHAAGEIPSREVIDSHEVVILTVDERIQQGDGLRSIAPTDSVVSGG